MGQPAAGMGLLATCMHDQSMLRTAPGHSEAARRKRHVGREKDTRSFTTGTAGIRRIIYLDGLAMLLRVAAKL